MNKATANSILAGVLINAIERGSPPIVLFGDALQEWKDISEALNVLKKPKAYERVYEAMSQIWFTH